MSLCEWLLTYMHLNYNGPLGSPLRVLRPVLVRYVQPFKPLIGVFDRRLDRRLVPQNVFSVEACGSGVGPVLVLSVAIYIQRFTGFVFVKGEIGGALGPEVNGSFTVDGSLKFFASARRR